MNKTYENALDKCYEVGRNYLDQGKNVEAQVIAQMIWDLRAEVGELPNRNNDSVPAMFLLIPRIPLSLDKDDLGYLIKYIQKNYDNLYNSLCPASKE